MEIENKPLITLRLPFANLPALLQNTELVNTIASRAALLGERSFRKESTKEMHYDIYGLEDSFLPVVKGYGFNWGLPFVDEFDKNNNRVRNYPFNYLMVIDISHVSFEAELNTELKLLYLNKSIIVETVADLLDSANIKVYENKLYIVKIGYHKYELDGTTGVYYFPTDAEMQAWLDYFVLPDLSNWHVSQSIVKPIIDYSNE